MDDRELDILRDINTRAANIAFLAHQEADARVRERMLVNAERLFAVVSASLVENKVLREVRA